MMAFVDAPRTTHDRLRDRTSMSLPMREGIAEQWKSHSCSPRCAAALAERLARRSGRPRRAGHQDEIQSQTDRSPQRRDAPRSPSWRVFTGVALAQTSEPGPEHDLVVGPDHRGHAVDLGAQHDAVAIGREQDEPMLKTWITVKGRARPRLPRSRTGRVLRREVHRRRCADGSPGDLSAPPEETLNCRCPVGLTPQSDAGASMEDRTSSPRGVPSRL